MYSLTPFFTHLHILAPSTPLLSSYQSSYFTLAPVFCTQNLCVSSFFLSPQSLSFVNFIPYPHSLYHCVFTFMPMPACLPFFVTYLQPFQKTLATPIFFLIQGRWLFCHQKWMTSNLGKCGMGYLDNKLP